MTVARVRLAVAAFLAAGVIAGAGASTAGAVVPTLSVSPVGGVEGSVASFTITPSVTSLLPITFDFSTISGTALAGTDFVPASVPQVVTLPASASSVTVPVSLICDSLTEGTETFTGVISNPDVNALITGGFQSTTAAITDTCQGSGPFPFPGTADLQMTSTPTVGSALLGQPLSYDLLLSNLGPSPAQNVTVFDALPGGTSFSGASTGQGFCTGATCSLGTVLAGQSIPIHVTWLPSALGTLVNTATVSSSTFDPNLANNATSAASSVVQSGTTAVGSGVAPVPVTDIVTDSSTSSDSAPPGVELHYDRACHLIEDRVCVVDVRPDEDSRVRVVWNAIIPAFARTARASRVVSFRTISRSVAGDDSRDIGLRPSRRVRLLIAAALAHRVPVTGRFRITATDAAGNARTLRRSFRIVR